MNVVVINKDQPECIKPMYTALKCQGLKPLFVFDRCKGNVCQSKAEELGADYICNAVGKDRQTSFCRNLGYRWLSDTMWNDGTLFLDADRWPVMGDLNELKNSPTDITLLKLETDFRDKCPVPYSKIYGTVYNNFFSCGIYIKEDACKKLIEFYKEREADYGHSLIFPESVQQYWGIEDTHLGDICYHLGLTADINNDIRLQGKFERFMVDSLDTIEQRFKLRDKLNVLW